MLSDAIKHLATKTGEGLHRLFDVLSGFWGSVREGFSKVASNFSTVIRNISDGFADVGKWFVDLGKKIGGFFSSLGKEIGGFFSSLVDSLGSWFKEVFNGFAKIVTYINPLSDKFFLKIAFVPRNDFIKDEINKVKTVFDQKFAVFDQLGDTIKAVWRVYDRADWQGIKVTIPLTNQTVTIVDPAPVNSVSKKIKFWMGGFLIIVTVMYVYRKLTNEVIR